MNNINETAKRELSETMADVWQAVVASGVPEIAQTTAFKEGLRAVFGDRAGSPASAPQPYQNQQDSARQTHGLPSSNDTPLGALTGDSPLAAVSAETGVPLAQIEKILYLDDGVVKLIGPHTRFGANTAARSRTIAQLVTVVSKLGLKEQETSLETIKIACDSKHSYDSKNFSTDMTKIDGFVVKGEKRNKRLEAKGAGIEAFSEVIDRILGTA